MDEIEFYIQQKWVIPQSARMSVVQPDNQGCSPLIGFMSFHNTWIKWKLSGEGDINLSNQIKSLDLLPRRNINNSEQSEQSSFLLDGFWNVVCRILLFATMNIRPHLPVSSAVLVHRCAGLAPYCPVSILEWVVSPHTNNEGWSPGDECAGTSDTLGKLPLHRAMEAVYHTSIFDEDIVHHGAGFDSAQTSPETDTNTQSSSSKLLPETQRNLVVADEIVCPRQDSIIYNNPKLENNRVQIIQKLLQWHKQAATTPFPNGRSPLTQAIVHGGSWHGGAGDDSMGILQLLWSYAPEQSLERDRITGLYPFMLAATISLPNALSRSEDEIVDNVYNLLRKDPQLVSGALGVSNTGLPIL